MQVLEDAKCIIWATKIGLSKHTNVVKFECFLSDCHDVRGWQGVVKWMTIKLTNLYSDYSGFTTRYMPKKTRCTKSTTLRIKD